MMNGLASSWSPYLDLDATSSDAELPIKGKSSFRERTAAVGREAALQKQLQEAIKDRQDLVKRYEVKEQKCSELRDKLKVTKAALGSRERELELAQRMLQKLTEEKTQLRDEYAEHKVYVRKLEAKLDELKNAAAISSKYQAAKQKATELQQQLVSVTAELGANKEVAAEQQRQIDRLNRAVEIRASELSQEAGGQDVSAKLLHSLAEAREESLELAKQLASNKAEMNRLKQSASRLASRAETAEVMRADAEVAAEQLKQRLEKLLGSSQEVTKSRADMAQLLFSARAEAVSYKSERDELAEVVLEMQEEIEQLKAATAAAKANGELAAAAAADEAMYRLADTHAAAEDARQQQQAREAHLSQRCTELAEHAAQMEAAMQQQLQAAQQTSHARQQQITVLESQLANRRQRELDLERQVAELQLKAEQLGGAVSSAEAAASRRNQLEQQVVRLEASLRVASVERQQLEQRLKQAGDDAAAQQQEVERELDALRVQLAAKEAAHRCILEDHAELQKQLGEVMQQLNKSTTAKVELQDNMLHQITSIKKKLQIAEQQSQQHLMAPSSPIFPPRPGGQNIARSTTQQQSGLSVAAALDPARSRSKVNLPISRQGVSNQLTRSISPGLAAGNRGSSTGRRSTGAGGADLPVQRQQQRRTGRSGPAATNGSSVTNVTAAAAAVSRAAGQHLAQAAVARVAEFAASLQQSVPVGSVLNQTAARPGALIYDSRQQVLTGLPRRPSSSHAIRPAIETATQMSSPSILRRSLDNSTMLRPGSIYEFENEGNAEAQMGHESGSAGAGLYSPPESHHGVSSCGGTGVMHGAVGQRATASLGSPSDGPRQQQQASSQQYYQHSRSLADDIDNMTWLDILKADAAATKQGASRGSVATTQAHAASSLNADLNSMRSQLYTYSPQGHKTQTTAAAIARSSSSHISSGTSRPPVCTESELQQQHPPTRSTTTSHSTRTGAGQSSHAMADVEASSHPAEASGSRAQSSSPAHDDLSWLQQPMEPYSPTVAARGPAIHSSVPSQHAYGSQRVAAGTVGVAGARHGDDLADPYSLPESAEQSAASVHAHIKHQQQQQGAYFSADPPRMTAIAAPGSAGAVHEPRAPTMHTAASAGAAEMPATASDMLHSCGAWEVTTDSDTSADEQPARDRSHSSRHSDCSMPEDHTSNQQLTASHRQHEQPLSRSAGPVRVQQSGSASLASSPERQAGQISGSPASSSPSSPVCSQQQHGRPGAAAASSQQLQDKLQATRAALRELSSKKKQTGTTAHRVHFPGPPAAEDADQQYQQYQQSTQTNSSQSAAVRQQVARAPEPPQAPKQLQQQMHSSRQSRAARFANDSDGGMHDRRSSDGSSSGSNRQSQLTTAKEHTSAGSRSAHVAAGGGFRSSAAELLSPPSTGKVFGAQARSKGVQPLPMQNLEGDAACRLGATPNRASVASQQLQQRRRDPSLASWTGADEDSNNGPYLRTSQMHDSQQQQQQQQQQHSRVLSHPVAEQPNSAGVQRVIGHQGSKASLQQTDHRAAAESRMSAMDSLLAKLSEGEPTLQDLAELENML